LIVLIANTHQRDPKGIVAQRDLEEIVASAKSCAGLGLRDNPTGCTEMALAQKDQLLEIGSRVRLGRPIICGRLSVSRDKSHPFQAMKFEQIFSLRCHTEQAESQEARRKSFNE
jgi:hypothetical protein